MTARPAQGADEPARPRAAKVAGLLLAAGAGTRMALPHPKALVVGNDGRTWLERSVAALRSGGATPVYVVVGAGADAVAAALPQGCRCVRAADWEEGMGASLRSGLAEMAVHSPSASAVMIMLVDTPAVTGEVVRRLLAGASQDVLARAAYDGQPGHPVLIGRQHWAGVSAVAAGDRGARDYLRGRHVDLVECADVGSGTDIDTAEALGEWLRIGDPD